jgi:drug/metabolite transporter (DMT)-like permease
VGKLKKTSSVTLWLAIGLLSALPSAPSGSIIKIVSETMDPATMVAVRYAIIALCCLPFLLRLKKSVVRRNLRDLLLASLFMSVTAASYVASIQMGQASYSAIISLLDPILLVVFSVFLLREKISRQIMCGVLVAMFGAAIVAVAPFLSGAESSINVSLGSIIFAIISTITYPLMLIFLRRANTGGVAMSGIAGFTAIVCMLVMTIVALAISGFGVVEQIVTTPVSSWLYLIGAALVIYLISRNIQIKAFEHVGAAAESGILYLEAILGIATPLLLLGENLTLEIVVGGLMIFTGVVISESAHRKIKNRRQHRGKHHLHHVRVR